MLEYGRPAEFKQHVLAADARLESPIFHAQSFLSQGRWDLTSASDAAKIASGIQRGIQRSPLVDTGVLHRIPDGITVALLDQLLTGPGGKVIFMRHGAQMLTEETQILEGAERKIALMQSKHNRADPLTGGSVVELGGLAFILGYLQARSHKPVIVETSPHMRAAQVGVVLAEALSVPGTPQVIFAVNDKLACVEYPENKSAEEINNILGPENNGSLKWQENIVDTLIGKGTFESITGDVEDLLQRGKERDAITIYVTHTQQTNAADILEGQNPTQLTELGFRVFTHDRGVIFHNGLYSLAA